MDKEIKTHKRKNKTPVDPGDLVSEKSLQKHYKIIGKVINLRIDLSLIWQLTLMDPICNVFY